MRATFIFFFDLAMLGVLVNSVARFVYTGAAKRHASGTRLLAGLSSVVTLFAMLALYGDAFRRAAMDAARAWTGESGITPAMRAIVVPLDRVTRDAVNAINPGADVGYRPHPVLWPLILVVLAYVVRGLVYLTLERRRHRFAAITTSAYTSHVTAYLLIVAFLVEIAGWNAMVVVLVSAILLTAFLVGLAGVFEDVAVLVKAALEVVSHYIHGVGGRIAREAASVARVIRLFFKDAHTLYHRRVRTPLRRATQRAVNAAAAFDDETEKQLKQEDALHREQFPEDDEAPGTGYVTS